MSKEYLDCILKEKEKMLYFKGGVSHVSYCIHKKLISFQKNLKITLIQEPELSKQIFYD